MLRKIVLSVALIALSSSAFADETIDQLSAGGSIGGPELIPMFQLANPAVTTTPNALSTYLASTLQTLTNKTINGANNTLTVRIGSDVSGLGTNVATFLGTPSSANLLAALTTSTGSGLAVFGTSPSLATPTISGATWPDGTSMQRVSTTVSCGSPRRLG